MDKRIISFVKFLLFFSLGGVILFLLYRSQANSFAEQCQLDGILPENCNYFTELVNDFKSVKIQWLLLVIFMYMSSNVVRSLRWMMMFKPMGYKIKFENAIGTLMFGYFANLGLPRLGEILRPVALSRYEKVEVEKVVGTIVAERALDMLLLLMFIGLALFLEYETLWNYISENQAITDKLMLILTSPIFYIALILGAAFGIYFLFSKSFKKSKIGQKLWGLANGFMDGIKSIFQLERPLLFVFYTVFIWVMYLLMTRLCFFAFEPTSHLSFTTAIMIFVFGTLGIVFPSPGGMGSYHILVMAGLALYGIESSDAFSYANIIFFSIQFFCNIFFGLLAYLLLPLLNKNYAGAIRTQNSQ